MFQGKLWLDYSDEDEEAHYQARIPRLIKREKEISFDFNGTDGEDGVFSGHCNAVMVGDTYKGTGEFKYPDGTIIKSQASFTVEEEKNELFLSGEWKDEGETKPYSLEAELSKQ